MDRTGIGNAIIAGIASADTALEQMSEIVTHLERAGWVIVPREPTPEMYLAAYAANGGKWADDEYEPPPKICWREMIDAAVARS